MHTIHKHTLIKTHTSILYIQSYTHTQIDKYTFTNIHTWTYSYIYRNIQIQTYPKKHIQLYTNTYTSYTQTVEQKKIIPTTVHAYKHRNNLTNKDTNKQSINTQIHIIQTQKHTNTNTHK